MSRRCFIHLVWLWFFETGPCYVARDGFEHTILLLLSMPSNLQVFGLHVQQGCHEFPWSHSWCGAKDDLKLPILLPPAGLGLQEHPGLQSAGDQTRGFEHAKQALRSFLAHRWPLKINVFTGVSHSFDQTSEAALNILWSKARAKDITKNLQMVGERSCLRSMINILGLLAIDNIWIINVFSLRRKLCWWPLTQYTWERHKQVVRDQLRVGRVYI